ncbi:MAG: UDP-glucose 4-epimerase GalE, partial [Methylocella sp.]
MTVLVTGGAGYIGGHMVLALLDAGEKVVVIDDLSTGFRWVVPDAAKLIVGDVGHAALIEEILGKYNIDAIAHFAAKIVVPESIGDPLRYYLNNTAKARTLLECAARGKIKHFIFSSTAAVYGEPLVTPVGETVPPAPINPYGRSKLMTEWMLEDAAKAHGLKFAILRYFNVAGADPNGRLGQSTPTATHLIKVAVQAALGLRPGLEVFGTDYPTRDGTCIRDYIQVNDLVAAHLMALDYLRRGGESLVCNCGYGRGVSVLEV